MIRSLIKKMKTNNVLNLFMVSLLHFLLIFINVKLFEVLPDHVAVASNPIGMVLVTLLFMSAYISFISRKNSEQNLFNLGWLFVLIAAGMIFAMGFYKNAVVIIAISQWALYKSVYKIIFMGKTEFMEKLSKIVWFISVFIWLLLLLVPLKPPFLGLIYKLYGYYNNFLNFSPILIGLVHINYIKSLFRHQKVEFLVLCLVIMIEPITTTIFILELNWISVDNISNFTLPALLLLLVQWRLFHNIMKRKMSILHKKFTVSLLIIGLGFLASIALVGVAFSWHREAVYLVVNILVWAFAFVITVMETLITSSDETSEISLLNSVSAIALVANDDHETQEFADFLHNQVLQGIVVIKNLNEYSGELDVKEQINQSSDDLIKLIRRQLDYYNSDYSDNLTPEENYASLVHDVETRLTTSKKIDFSFEQSSKKLPDPYGRLIYRIIEELSINAIKHSSSEKIELSVVIDENLVYLECKNEWNPDEKSKNSGTGKGQKLLQAKVELLQGKYTVTKGNMQYISKIEIPIDKEIANEYFVSR